MKGTILIVDDNREIVDSLGKLLAIEGYDILTAYDGSIGSTGEIST